MCEASGVIYEGEFYKNKKHGEGTENYKYNLIFIGLFSMHYFEVFKSLILVLILNNNIIMTILSYYHYLMWFGYVHLFLIRRNKLTGMAQDIQVTGWQETDMDMVN